jgi:outer membrane protein OmpA-like peptidoglycan-associated protein
VSTAAPRSRNRVPVVPLPTVRVERQRVMLPNALLFAYNSAEVQVGAQPDLVAVVERVRRTGESVQVVGHTDVITGSPAANRKLSQRRAQAVADCLLDLGLARDRLEKPVGVGSAGASASLERSDPARTSRDRKVEITFHH